jgi:hypothetical protein
LQDVVKGFGMEMSQEKSQMMAFLGQDRITCKIITDVNNKQTFLNTRISVMTFTMMTQTILKSSKCCSSTVNCKQQFSNYLGSKIFKNKSLYLLALSILFIEAKSGSSERRI